MINNILWTKREKKEGEINGEGKGEINGEGKGEKKWSLRGDNHVILEKENSLDDKGLEHWMEIWRKERKEWEASHNIINLKFQVNEAN